MKTHSILPQLWSPFISGSPEKYLLDTKEALPLQRGSPGLSWTPFLDFEPQLVLPEDSGVLIKGKK